MKAGRTGGHRLLDRKVDVQKLLAGLDRRVEQMLVRVARPEIAGRDVAENRPMITRRS